MMRKHSRLELNVMSELKSRQVQVITTMSAVIQ
jgi:hypothetical protein